MYKVKENVKIIADNTAKMLLTDIGLNLCRETVTKQICNCIPNPYVKIAVKGVGMVTYFVACNHFTEEESSKVCEAFDDMLHGEKRHQEKLEWMRKQCDEYLKANLVIE